MKYQFFTPLIGALLAALFRKKKLRTWSVWVAGIVCSIMIEGIRGYTLPVAELLQLFFHTTSFTMGYMIVWTILKAFEKKNPLKKLFTSKELARLLVRLVILVACIGAYIPSQKATITYRIGEDQHQIRINYQSARTIWNYLRGTMGCSRAAASGILGNMYAESAFQSDIVESNGVGHGIGQWSWDRWYGSDGLQTYAESRGRNWEDLDLQLDFLRHEIVERNSMNVFFDGGFSRYKDLRKIEGENGTAQVFFYSFEYGNYVSYEDFLSDRFETNYATRSKRLSVANRIYQDKRQFP